MKKLLQEAFDEIKLFMEGESCDHSVGICYCKTISLLERMEAALHK